MIFIYNEEMVNRKELDEIILKNDANDWWQPELFEKNTKHLLPSELEILENPPSENQNYNCFLYVLGLHRDGEVLNESSGFIYDSLIKHLLDIDELRKTDFPVNGDYIVYQDLKNYPDSLTHIGVLDRDKVISKWAWGPLIKHNVWDVPAEYGDDIFYVKGITSEKAKELYSKYKEFNRKDS